MGSIGQLSAGVRSKQKSALATQTAAKLEALFQIVDADQSGDLDPQEFASGVWKIPGVSRVKLSTGETLTEQRLKVLARMLEQPGSGGINVLGFLEALSIE